MTLRARSGQRSPQAQRIARHPTLRCWATGWRAVAQSTGTGQQGLKHLPGKALWASMVGQGKGHCVSAGVPEVFEREAAVQ